MSDDGNFLFPNHQIQFIRPTYLITATATVPRVVFTKVLDKKRRKRVESDDLHQGRTELASKGPTVEIEVKIANISLLLPLLPKTLEPVVVFKVVNSLSGTSSLLVVLLLLVLLGGASPFPWVGAGVLLGDPVASVGANVVAHVAGGLVAHVA